MRGQCIECRGHDTDDLTWPGVRSPLVRRSGAAPQVPPPPTSNPSHPHVRGHTATMTTDDHNPWDQPERDYRAAVERLWGEDYEFGAVAAAALVSIAGSLRLMAAHEEAALVATREGWAQNAAAADRAAKSSEELLARLTEQNAKLDQVERLLRAQQPREFTAELVADRDCRCTRCGQEWPCEKAGLTDPKDTP